MYQSFHGTNDEQRLSEQFKNKTGYSFGGQTPIKHLVYKKLLPEQEET